LRVFQAKLSDAALLLTERPGDATLKRPTLPVPFAAGRVERDVPALGCVRPGTEGSRATTVTRERFFGGEGHAQAIEALHALSR
jgi:hypothetical protein